MKRKIFQCRTGTLYNQTHAVRFKRSSSLVFPLQERHHTDSALHTLSGCQCPVIHNMVTERHNIASRMILKVVNGGSYGSNLLHMDVGSADRLAQHDLQEKKENKNYIGIGSSSEETLPASIQEKETHWLRRVVSPLHHKAVI
eukprot:1159819-Pelagomonas_calceolata.AAC.1